MDWSETSEEALLEASNNPVAQDTSSNANKSALETAMGNTKIGPVLGLIWTSKYYTVTIDV